MPGRLPNTHQNGEGVKKKTTKQNKTEQIIVAEVSI